MIQSSDFLACDFLVIGGGIAGASAAYYLAGKGRVILLEREDTPGYHTTGRSAALFTMSYGPPVIRALSAASRAFFAAPPEGFAAQPLMTPLGSLDVAGPGEDEALEEAWETARKSDPEARRLARDETLALCGALRPETVIGAIHWPAVRELDVDALLHGYLRGAKARGADIVTGAEVRELGRTNGHWQAETTARGFAAPVVINAAGAWADVIGKMAGAAPIGLVPKRRTVINFDAPDGMDVTRFPITGSLDDGWFFKPEAGRMMASPSDETPSAPCDAQPEELDIAITADRIQKATSFDVRRITHSRAGLRSFVADGMIVGGFAPDAEGFFWLAGQGGYGITTSPAMGRITAALASGEPIPEDIAELGVNEAVLSPGRLTA